MASEVDPAIKALGKAITDEKKVLALLENYINYIKIFALNLK
jgi:uncharacterized protein YeeX (DUF496 family)